MPRFDEATLKRRARLMGWASACLIGVSMPANAGDGPDLHVRQQRQLGALLERAAARNARAVSFAAVDGEQDLNTLLTYFIADLRAGTFSIGTAKDIVISSDGDGAVTFLGAGDGSDEDLTINLDDTANTATLSSSTGVVTIAFPTGAFQSGTRLNTLTTVPRSIIYDNLGLGRAFSPNGTSNNVIFYIGDHGVTGDYDVQASSGNLYTIAAEGTLKATDGNNTNHTAMWAQVWSDDDGSSRTVSNQYGIYIAGPQIAHTLAVTNAYGLWVDEPASATGASPFSYSAYANWGIVNKGALSQTREAYFESNIRLVTNNQFLYGMTTGAVAKGLIAKNSANNVALGDPSTGDYIVPAAGASASDLGAPTVPWGVVRATTYAVSSTLAISSTAPTISSGFGTTPSVVAKNGTAAFTINVGTGGTASAGVITMPTATTGYNCSVENRTGVAANRADQRTVQTATTTTSVTVQNQTISSGAALAWTASDILALMCFGY